MSLEEENFLNEDEDNELTRWYAQIHAWRALGQLKAEDAIPNLIGLLYPVDEYDDDWSNDDLVQAFDQIGPACIPALAVHLQDASNADYPRNIAIEAVENIKYSFPETRAEGIAAILPALKNHKQNDESTNGFLIYALAKFNAVEHIDLIKEVFDTDNVDLFIMGDFQDVQIEMGLIDKRKTPRDFHLVTKRDMENMEAEYNRKMNAVEKKEKKKRRQEKKSRKKNRKRK